VSAFDVIIVGGGVIGSSIAFELSGEKMRVALLDRQEPGKEASWAAAGMLSAVPDSPKSLPLVPLANESLQLYPEFVATLLEASGKSVDFAHEGAFEIFTGPSAEFQRDRMLAECRRLGIAGEAISPDVARRRESALGGDASALAWFPEEATVDPRQLMEAVLAGANQRGAQIHTGCVVDSLLYEGGRCVGVTACGKKFESTHVVIAAGSYCGTVENEMPEEKRVLAQYAPVHPVRGQMIALRSDTVQLKCVLRSEKGYLVPRSDGRIIAGSTLEDAGFEKRVTPDGVRRILDGVLSLAPALRDAQIVDTWSGLRPGTPDHLPIIGPTDIPGLMIATGHYRNGILLAPVTAKIVRNWIIGGKANFSAEDFSPLRFTKAKERARTSGGMGFV
jgi:glycine oxidase